MATELNKSFAVLFTVIFKISRSFKGYLHNLEKTKFTIYESKELRPKAHLAFIAPILPFLKYISDFFNINIRKNSPLHPYSMFVQVWRNFKNLKIWTILRLLHVFYCWRGSITPCPISHSYGSRSMFDLNHIVSDLTSRGVMMGREQFA